MNKGQLKIIYLGDEAGDKNLSTSKVETQAEIHSSNNGMVVLSFDFNYPGMPSLGKLSLLIKHYSAHVGNLNLFVEEVLKISDTKFMLTAMMVYEDEKMFEHFKIISLFEGAIPNNLTHFDCSDLLNK